MEGLHAQDAPGQPILEQKGVAATGEAGFGGSGAIRLRSHYHDAALTHLRRHE